MPFELYDFNFAIFASWRELFFLDGHYLSKGVMHGGND
jgi:hypothetical protein